MAHTDQILQYAISRQVVGTATRISAIVGTLLALINHGPGLVAMELGPIQWFQIGLTYLVPYCVSTYSSVKILTSTTSEQV